MEETQKKGKGALWAIAVVVIAAVTFGAVKLGKKDTIAPVDSNNTNTEEETTQNSTATSYTYKDGSYSAVGTYTSPAGPEEIAVTVSVKDDKIVSSNVIPKATHQVSIKLQGMFIGGVDAVVVGKDLDDVVLDKVAGSSLTPKGWNDAVVKIQAQARI